MVGDRILSVNDVSLIGKDRHATVSLVKQGGNVVRLKIFRYGTMINQCKTHDESICL